MIESSTKMFVGVWELVLFLWSHPIILGMVVVLCSPPFYPVLVYFSPLLICTALVVIAMVSLNVGGSIEKDPAWKDGTSLAHEPAMHVDTQLKPAKEGWLQRVKKLEERILAWMPSRLFNFERWQFRKNAQQKLLHQGLSIPVLEVARERVAIDKVDPKKFRVDVAKHLDRSGSRDVTSEGGDDGIPLTGVPVTHGNQNLPRSLPCDLDETQPYESKCSPGGEELTRTGGGIGHSQSAAPEAAHDEEAIKASGEANVVIEPPHVASKSGSVHGDKQPVAEKEIEVTEKEIEPPHVASKSGSVHGDTPSVADKEIEPSVSAGGVRETVAKAEDNGRAFQESSSEKVSQIHVNEPLGGAPDETPKLKPGHATNEVTLDVETRNPEAPRESREYSCFASKDVGANPLRGADEEQEFVAAGLEKSRAFGDDGELSRPEQKEDAPSDAGQPSTLSQRLIASETTIFVDEVSAAKSLAAEGKEQLVDLNRTWNEQKSLATYDKQVDRNDGGGLDESAESRGWELLACNEPVLSTSKAIVSQGALASELQQSYDLVESPYANWVEVSSGEEQDFDAGSRGTFSDGNAGFVKPNAIQQSDDLNERFVALRKSMARSTSQPREPNGRRNSDLSLGKDGVRSSDSKSARFGENSVPSLVFPGKQRHQPVAGTVGFNSVEELTDRLQRKFSQNPAQGSGITLKAKPASDESIPSSIAAIIPVPDERDKKANANSTFIVSPLVNSVISNNGIPASESVNSKRFLASLLSRRRKRLMTPSVETFPPSNGLDRVKEISSGTETPTTTEIVVVHGAEHGIQIGNSSCEDRSVGSSEGQDSAVTVTSKEGVTDKTGEESQVEDCGPKETQAGAEVANAGPTRVETSSPALEKNEVSTSTTRRLIKEKVMSPIKRVFLLDANGISSKKTDSNKASTPKSLPVKEKQLGKDKPKNRLMKLFSFDGSGVTKLDGVEAEKPAGSNTKSLRKSRLVSGNRVQQDGIAEEGGSGSSPNDSCNVSSQNSVEGPNDSAFEQESAPECQKMPASGPLQQEDDSNSEAVPIDLPVEPQSSARLLSPPPKSHCQKLPIDVKFCLHKLSVVGGPARLIKQKEVKPSADKKFALSWTKKKRCSNSLEADAEHLKLTEEQVSSKGHSNGELPRENCISPIRRFHSASAIDIVDSGFENLTENDDVREKESFWANSKNWQSTRMSSPSPKNMPLSSGNQEDPAAENVNPSEKWITTPWWRRHSRGGGEQLQEALSPAESENLDTLDRAGAGAGAASPEKGTSIPFHSWARRREKSVDANFDGINSLRIDDEELTAGGNLHSWARSDSMPTTGTKFTRLRKRQPSSFFEAAVAHPPELSRASSGRAASSLNSTSSMSARRTDDGLEDDRHVSRNERRNSDLFESMCDSSNIPGRNNARSALYSSTTMPPIRTQGPAQDLRNSFGRSDTNVNVLSKKQQHPVAEISITNKLKVPLEEVLSLLSTGKKEDSTAHGTAGSATTDGNTPEDHKQAGAASSSSSEDKSSSSSSEEEWSSASEDEEESKPQPQLAPLLPPAARIRKKLPHYIFTRESTPS